MSQSRARHDGITCDFCNAHNFTGKRFKCLICYDYDLCTKCYESGLISADHSTSHYVQCILTKAEFEIHFAGENLQFQRAHSFTCPVCGVTGLSLPRIREHATAEHNRTHQEVVCSVCAAMSGYNSNTLTSCLGSHITSDHSASGRQQDDRLATIRRHMASAQADSTSQSSSLSATQRRRVGNERTAAEYYRSSNGLRGQTPTYVTPDPRTPTTAGTNTTAAPPGGAAGRLDMDAELGDYGEYLAIHDSIMQDSRLGSRLADEARRQVDQTHPLYRYLAHPRFNGSGLRVVPTSASSQTQSQSQTGGGGGGGGGNGGGNGGGTAASGAQRSGGQFPSNDWECLMNSSAPVGEFILPRILNDDSTLGTADGDADGDAGTCEERAEYSRELLLSLLDVRLDSSLLDHLETLSSDSEPEPSVETDV